MHENILLGVGFRGSHWSRFRSRFTKSMTSKNYNKLWNLTFRYKLFITFVSSTEFVGCMYMILSLSVRSLLRTKVRSFVPSFVRAFVSVGSFACAFVSVRSFVRAFVFVGSFFFFAFMSVRLFARVFVTIRSFTSGLSGRLSLIYLSNNVSFCSLVGRF